jgi:hypothetical protein
MGRDQSGRDGISACAGRVGYRDRGNCAIPRHRDPRLRGCSLALVSKHSTFPRMNHLRKLGLASFFLPWPRPIERRTPSFHVGLDSADCRHHHRVTTSLPKDPLEFDERPESDV